MLRHVQPTLNRLFVLGAAPPETLLQNFQTPRTHKERDRLGKLLDHLPPTLHVNF